MAQLDRPSPRRLKAGRHHVGWLDSRYVHDLVAHIHPDHLASAKGGHASRFPAHPRPGRRRAGLASTDERAEVALQEELMRLEPLYRIPFTYPESWAVGLDSAGNSGPAPLDRGSA
jgi:hypothetical protein